MTTNILIVPKINNPGSVFPIVAVIDQVVHNFNKKHPKRPAKIIDNLDHLSTQDKLLVIAIGGDGTMLDAMKRAARSPIETHVVGINLGTVGFLTDFTPNEELFDYVWEMIADSQFFPIEKRMGLDVKIRNDNTLGVAFNEFSISSETSDTMIKYRLLINGHNAGEHRANSILVGTPTGSTAYTLSAGGGLLLPSMEAIQIVPVAPFSLTSRPIITSGDSIINIVVTSPNDVVIRADGQLVGSTNKQAELRISKGPSVSIIHSYGWNYFDMLTQKLGWKSV